MSRGWLFVFAEEGDRDTLRIFDFADGSEIGTVEDKAFKQLKPNSGIRGMIGAALVQFQLTDPDPNVRATALDAIDRDPEPSHLAALRASMQSDDALLGERKARTERLLTIRFGDTDEERIAAIREFEGDLGVDLRATLNPLVQTQTIVSETALDDPAIARQLMPGDDALSKAAAYDLLVAEDLAPPHISSDDQRNALIANIADGQVAGIEVASLDTQEARDLAYAALGAQGVGANSPPRGIFKAEKGQIRSIAMAVPSPPPMQMAATPRFRS